MAEKVLMKGNEALAEAALRAGCRSYYGYPITPQTDIAGYMAKKLLKMEGGTFIQAESEIAAINMVLGAASTGQRTMTSSSSPGISLKQEGLSYIAGCEVPCVVVNMVRSGPGLGGILPAQGDYFQAVKGGGHGDYRMVVLAPAGVQEIYDLTREAFDIADLYRIAVMIIGDGAVGMMMEPVDFDKPIPKRALPPKDWALTGTKMKRKKNIINSLYIEPDALEALNNRLQEKYRVIQEKEVKVEEYHCDGAEIIVAAYGTTARVVKNVIRMAEKDGIRVGLIRPITLWPFPTKTFEAAADKVDQFLVVEMNTGQMVEDVRLAVNGKKPVHFYGRTGGNIPTQHEIYQQIKQILSRK